MDQLPWCGYIGGKRRDRHVDDVFDLLSNGELNSGQMHDLHELLERRLADPIGLKPGDCAQLAQSTL